MFEFDMEMDHKQTNEIIACAYLGGVYLRNFIIKDNIFCNTSVSVVSLNEGGWPCRSFDDWSPGSHPGSPSSFPL